ncbi:hypothetical protein Tco_1154700 [Tanacetum coccineum]
MILQYESIDTAFARFNTIITSLKALDEGYSSKNYVRKFLRALHPKWRAKITALEESKDLTSLSINELIGNLKVHEVIIKKDSEIVKAKGERRSLALKAKKESSDDECSTSGSEDEECPKPPRDKNQRAFVGGSWSDSSEEDDEKIKDKTCLVAQTPNEICLGVDLEPDEWIKDIGCSKHMMGNRKLFSTYKANNGGNAIFGSNICGNIIGKGKIFDNKCRVTFFEHDSEITKDGKVIGRGNLDKSTNNVLIPLDSWTSGLLVYRLPLSDAGGDFVHNGLDVPTQQILDSRGTSDGLAVIQAQLNNLGREIKKVNQKVYAAQVGCEQCKGPHYTKDCPQKEEGKTIEEAYYTQFGGPFQGGGYRATAPSESAKRHKENSNLIKEIRALTDAAIRNQGASIKTLEIQIGQMSKVLQERGFRSLPNSTETNPRDQVKSISTTIEADSNSIRRIGSNQYAVSTGQNSTLLYKSRQMTVPFPSRLDNHYCEEEGNYGPKFTEAYGASHINNTIPRKEKDPGSFTLPCFINDFCFDNALVDLGASVSVMPLSTYLNLGLGELAHTRLTVELADRTVKYPKGIAKNVLVGIGKFTFPIDFIILDMPEDVKVPLFLERPFLTTARAKIDVYKRKITLRLRERIELDLEARLMGETLVLNRSLDPFLEDYIELNDLNEPFELRRNQGDDLMPTIEEGEVIEEYRTRDKDLDTGIDDYPSYCDDDKKIHIDFLEDIDAYRDNEMGDVIFGEPFLREVGIKTKRFEGIITLYNGNNEVTYQMVSKKDEINGISLAYQKLKGFYKEVLNLGPDFIRVLSMEEWLTCGHISVHELE